MQEQSGSGNSFFAAQILNSFLLGANNGGPFGYIIQDVYQQ